MRIQLLHHKTYIYIFRSCLCVHVHVRGLLSSMKSFSNFYYIFVYGRNTLMYLVGAYCVTPLDMHLQETESLDKPFPARGSRLHPTAGWWCFHDSPVLGPQVLYPSVDFFG